MKSWVRNKKGQASIEYMAIYAWAILLISIALVLVWQWGLLDISGKTERGYSGFWGIVPVDWKFESNGDITLVLANGIGAGVNVTCVDVTILNTTSSMALNERIDAGNKKTIVISTLRTGGPGDFYFIDLVEITYIDHRTNVTHRSSGHMWGGYE